MDETILRHSADSVNKGENVETWFERLRSAEAKLRKIIDANFDEAVKREDEASIERFFKLFPLINRQKEGIAKFTSFLCAKLRAKTERHLSQARQVCPGDKRSHIVWADAVTLLFEEIARTVEVRQPILETYYELASCISWLSCGKKSATAWPQASLAEMQKQEKTQPGCCNSAGLAQVERGSAPKRGKQNCPSGPTCWTPPWGTHSDECAAELYLRFLKRRVLADFEASIENASVRSQKTEAFESRLARSQLVCDMTVVIGTYTILEQFYLNESLRKAVLLDKEEGANKNSSLVDDAFYIIKKSVRRAIASSSVDGICAMLNHSVDLLDRRLAAGFHQTLRKGFPVQGYLDLTQAYTVFQSSIQSGKISSTSADSDVLRQEFLTALNNAETSGRYVKSLETGFRETIETSMRDLSPTARAKLESCLNDLKTTAGRFRTVVDFGLSQLQATAIKPKVKPWVDSFTTIPHDITEEEFGSYEANDPFSQQLMVQLDSLLGSFLPLLTPDNHKSLVEILVKEVASQLEKAVSKSAFNRFGGLQFDREIRAIAGYLSQVSEWSVREQLARLTQMATLLNLEDLSEVAEYSTSTTWRLTPTEMKKTLQLRVDFKYEDIQRLKL
ncbi:UNVERIFIED_CONTAM: hypothetical protein GTU68_060667 [Idotea baltica]|nr:hypothetical protein [Idotea baltica]